MALCELGAAADRMRRPLALDQSGWRGDGPTQHQKQARYDEEQQADDFSFENTSLPNGEGVTLLIDPMSFQYLKGAEIDYVENIEGAQFVIRNPNAKSTCGCGSSFEPAEPAEEADNQD